MRKRLRKKLSNSLSSEALSKVYSSFDLLGGIAIIKAPSNLDDAKIVAKQIMSIHKGVKTVFSQSSPIRGDYRTRQLILLSGENTTITKYKEAGCVFSVDLEKCYFSPRLSHERLRIATQVSPHEVVVNMFSGVGCFSIIMAKTTPEIKVYSIDVNPVAHQYMLENVRVNRVYGKVYPVLGDSKDIVEKRLQGVADRILMPLPEKALEYLPLALSALKKSGGWIHFYDFQHAIGNEDPVEKTELKVAKKLESLDIRNKIEYSRIVRSIGPHWYQTVLDIHILSTQNKF